MERHYETVCIVNMDIGEPSIKEVVKKAVAVVEKYNGKNIEVEEWGRRRLAYSIQKKREGYYALFTYSSEPEASKELERYFKYNEGILRYQTVTIVKRKEKDKEKDKEKGEKNV